MPDTLVIKERVTKEVTTEELRDVLFRIHKGTFCNIHYVTMPIMRIWNNGRYNEYYGNVVEYVRGNVLIGCSYSSRVQKVTNNIGFKSGRCKIGNHVTRCVLYNDNTKRYYLQYEWFKNVPMLIDYYYDGKLIDKKLISEHIIGYKESHYNVNSQAVRIDNIREMTIDKVKYIIVK